MPNDLGMPNDLRPCFVIFASEPEIRVIAVSTQTVRIGKELPKIEL